MADGDYRCAKCNTPLSSINSELGLQCEKCGYKIFFKDRPSDKQTYSTD